MSDRLTPEREAVIRQGQPTDWLSKPWTITEIEGDGETPGSWQVLHESTVIATLPDWAGNLALWMAEAPEDIQALLAELAAVRAERDLAQRKVASLKAQQDKDDAEYAEVIAERDRALKTIAELEAERLTQNQALDDAVRELRTPYAERARRERHPGRRQAWLMLASAQEAERVADVLLNPKAARSASKGPQPSVEGEHYAAVHHDYRQGRDLPYTQTAEEAS